MKAIRGIWRFIKTVGYALTFVFVPRDYPDAGVKIGRLDTCCGLLSGIGEAEYRKRRGDNE